MTEEEYLNEYNTIGEAHNELVRLHQKVYMEQTGYTRGNWGPPIEPYYSELMQNIQPLINQLKINLRALKEQMK